MSKKKKLQIEAERLNLEKEKLEKKLEAETLKPNTKPNIVNKDVNTKTLVPLIMAKLPKDVITHMDDQKEDFQEWTVNLLRDELHRYITNRENAERQCSTKDDSKHPFGSTCPTSMNM